MNIERQFLLHLAHTGKIQEALEAGITQHDFLGDDMRKVFVSIQKDYMSMASTGCLAAIKRKFPRLFVDDDPYREGMTMPHYFHELRTQRLSKAISKLCDDALKDATKLLENPQEILSRMYAECTSLAKLDTRVCVDTSLYKTLSGAVDRYQAAKEGQPLGLYDWPWAPVQNATGGVQEADYVILYGRPKSKKSWVLAYLAAYTLQKGKRVLFYTKEMTPMAMGARVTAAYLSIDATELRMGKLCEDDETQLYGLLEAYPGAQDNFMFLSAQDVDGKDTPTWLKGRIDTWKPDVVFIDGVYLMTPDSMNSKAKLNEKCSEISVQLRQIQLATKLPFICTLQANRGAAKHEEANFDEIALSDGFSRDCTMAIRVMSEKGETIVLKPAGVREGLPISGFRINARCAKDFSYVGELTDGEVADAESADDKANAPTNPTPPTTPKIRRSAAAKPKKELTTNMEDLMSNVISSSLLKASNG